MISKITAQKLAYESENKVFSTAKQINDLIKLHAKLGHFHIEVFTTRKLANSCRGRLQNKGFNVTVGDIESTPNQCLLYVSW